MATIVSYTKDEIDALLGVKVYVQSTPPVDPPAQYIWWDTSGGNLTLWIEDGA